MSVECTVWVRPGVTMTSALMAKTMRALESIESHRDVLERNPGKWALELRDGVPWAPWCPVGWISSGRGGDPLPYRPTKLRKTRGARECYGCKTVLSEGSKAWRPDPEGERDGPADAEVARPSLRVVRGE